MTTLDALTDPTVLALLGYAALIAWWVVVQIRKFRRASAGSVWGTPSYRANRRS